MRGLTFWIISMGFVAFATSFGCGSDGGSSSSDGTGAGQAGGGNGCIPVTESCDGIDNDCDGEVDEDCACSQGDEQECYSGDPTRVGVGVCARGTQICDAAGTWGGCAGEVIPSAEICDGDDNDCNGEADEGFGTSTCGLGACQVTVDECINGVAQACTPLPANTTDECDGVDDDCDGSVDEGCTCLNGAMQPCYTGTPQTQNVGVCSDGLQTCVSGAWSSCVGDVLPDFEQCNGLDDDCDGVEDDGNPDGGGACNTGLSGPCGAGVSTCVMSGPGGMPGIVCQPLAMPSAEICDGIDNDCNPATPDGSGDPMLNQGCDGPDSDSCVEGVFNGCVNGSLTCSDSTPGTVETCAGNGADEDCDGMVDEGFPRDDNPLCSGGQFFLGVISGDTGSEMATDSWYNEEWDRVTISEDSLSSVYVSATITLTSPPGVDYDLYVYCDACGGTLAGSSISGGLTGHTDTVGVRANDSFGVDDTFDVVIEVRHFASNMCAYWSLEVSGNEAVGAATCN